MGKTRALLTLFVVVGVSACGQGSVQQVSDERTTAEASVRATVTPRSPEPTRTAAASTAPVPTSSGPVGVPSPPATTPALVPPIVPVTEEPAPDLTTYAGTAVDASFEFDHPSVIFTASRDVATMQAAIDYTDSKEYRQIQAMMASFRG
ncbi:hypothetical protein IWX65_000523 [Arthrobacter sp. CAN_A214]|uniref:hypothetical protein n=1 Tax=Arthrobacter sp. CAN_A214 TaxID=2787720 RepID=UPI0018C97082